MKHLLSILLISTLFCGELEVEGDLTVTGQIQSQTIDSLMQIIADLQAQIALLQEADNKLETRLLTIENFEIPYWDTSIEFNIRELLDEFNLSQIVVSFFSFEHQGNAAAFEFKIELYNPNTNESGDYIYIQDKEDLNGTLRSGGIIPMNLNSEKVLKVKLISTNIGNPPFYGTLQLAITAQFPSDSRNTQDSSVLSKEKTK